MKKFKFILFLFVALGVVATSCSKDDDDTTPVDETPVINFKGGNGYVSDDVTVTAGEEFVIGITANENSNTGKNLRNVGFTVTNNNAVIIEGDSAFNETSYNVDYAFTLDNLGESVIKFEVTDKAEKTSSVSLTVTVEAATTPLGDAADFTWTREAGNAATGLDAFGLKWENNLKLVSAVIEKDAATKMVQLSADAWTTFATVEDLMAAVDAGEDMEDYRGVSVEANADYDDVLGVIYNDEYYMIHITSGTVETGTAGTTVNILGQSMK
jgi:hypothetical protein